MSAGEKDGGGGGGCLINDRGVWSTPGLSNSLLPPNLLGFMRLYLKHLCFNLRKADIQFGMVFVMGTGVETLKSFSGVILTPEMGNLVYG